MPSNSNHHQNNVKPSIQQNGDAMDVSVIFERFGLDSQYGFVTNVRERIDPVLPAEFLPLEQLVADLPAFTATGRIRPLVDALPLIDVTPILGNQSACERAYHIISFIAHGYVRGRRHDRPLPRLPEALARPWILLAEALGTLPVSTYCSTVLYNFRLLDPSQSLTLENTWTLTTSSGSIDESWFYLTALAIESCSGEIIRLILNSAGAAGSCSYEALLDHLTKLASAIINLESTLMRMYEENIPAVFYQRVRRYLSGWLNDEELPEGLLYGEDPTPKLLAGGSAAQSPIIQCLDIALDVQHGDPQAETVNTGVGSAGAYLREMRRYMARGHREFLGWLEENINLRKSLLKSNMPSSVRRAFNDCVQAVRSFRNKHLSMVSTYITVQATKIASGHPIKGTGGSNPIPFLKEVRSHMDHLELNEDESADGWEGELSSTQ